MKFNALQVRQEFGKILKKIQKSGEPAIVEKGREEVAVIMSLEAFRRRYVDFLEQEKKTKLLALFHQKRPKPKFNTLRVLRKLRYGSGN